MPLAGIRTRLRLSAPRVLCGVLYIHKHNYSDRRAWRKNTEAVWHADRETLSGSLLLKLSVFYAESKLSSVEKRQSYKSLRNTQTYMWPYILSLPADSHSLCATTGYRNKNAN